MIPIIIPTLKVEDAKGVAETAVMLAGCDCKPLVIVDHNRDGFTKTINRGLRQVQNHELACILVDDVNPLTANWLKLLAEPFDLDVVGFTGPSGPCRTRPQNIGRMGQTNRHILVDHLAFFCVLLRTKIGLLDENFIHYGSDVDMQWRSSYQSIWVTGVYVDHGVHAPIAEWYERDITLLHERYTGADWMVG